ncbi:hypothetical protein [Ehrlichia muris]|uniref:hypothetical protein n=1 Tax=Ehrlichia muris TaxID=35795 RepID=UPI0037C02B46
MLTQLFRISSIGVDSTDLVSYSKDSRLLVMCLMLTLELFRISSIGVDSTDLVSYSKDSRL